MIHIHLRKRSRNPLRKYSGPKKEPDKKIWIDLWKGYLLLANLKYAAFLWALVAIGCQKVEAKKPNILFVISDDQSYPYSSIYGSHMVSTPAFDYVAKQGALFTKAYVTSSGCSPS